MYTGAMTCSTARPEKLIVDVIAFLLGRVVCIMGFHSPCVWVVLEGNIEELFDLADEMVLVEVVFVEVMLLEVVLVEVVLVEVALSEGVLGEAAGSFALLDEKVVVEVPLLVADRSVLTSILERAAAGVLDAVDRSDI